MKTKKPDLEPSVLVLTNKGGTYGTGHFNRMSLVVNHLKKVNVESRFEMTETLCPDMIQTSAYKVIILDSRDDEFPAFIYENRLSHQYFIAVDNRGKGRQQADIVWDTLPHPDMSLAELSSSLRNCILNPSIFEFSGNPTQSKIVRCELSDLESGRYKADVMQHPVKGRHLSSMNEFQTKIIEGETVATYFGQTFFEALYLGKQVYLYDISEYHKQLSDWFLMNVNNHPDILNLLDGQGLHRLTALVRSILSGVLDFRAG